MYRWLGWSYVEKGQFQEGFDALSKYFESLGNLTAATADYNYYAQAAAKLGNIDVAANTYQRVLASDTSKTEIYDLIAKMYFDAKKFPEAAAAYEQKLAKLGPKSADYVSLGRAYYSTKDFANYVKADSAFSKVNQMSPTYVYGYHMRAQIANAIDSTQERFLAKPYYEKVVNIVETATDEKVKNDNKRYYIEALNYMGVYTYATTSNAQQALAFLDKALAIDPTNEYTLGYKKQIQDAAGGGGKGNNKQR
jgi:tetratricopeptide (TPR) repeat protein